MLREEVWQLVEESRSSGKFLPTLNATFLTLIPKEERVTNLKNFRPIALCNVIYKIISKVIALRLKPILPFIISKEQSGYVEGRKIMDSIILVHEIIHSLKITHTPGMLLKLDLSKDFDKLRWQYMKAAPIGFWFQQGLGLLDNEPHFLNLFLNPRQWCPLSTLLPLKRNKAR
jgi:hypothetical protein